MNLIQQFIRRRVDDADRVGRLVVVGIALICSGAAAEVVTQQTGFLEQTHRGMSAMDRNMRARDIAARQARRPFLDVAPEKNDVRREDVLPSV